MNDKTTIYNEQILPLIQQIDTITTAQDIPFIAAFQTNNDGYELSLYIPSNTHKDFKDNAKWWLEGVNQK